MKLRLAWLAPVFLTALPSCTLDTETDIHIFSGQTRDTEIATAFGIPTHVVQKNEKGNPEWIYSLPDHRADLTEFSEWDDDENPNAMHVRTYWQEGWLTVLRFEMENGIVIRANANTKTR